MIKVVQIGMGPLGQKIAKFISERPALKIVGAVDKDPEKTGKDLGTLCSIPVKGISISSSLKEAMAKEKADVALLTTVSDMQRITSQIEEIVAMGLPIVSTCEELSFPWDTAPELSKRIDEAAKKNNVAVLGTGVNPGFLMDTLPICLTAVCQHVEKVKVSRFQNAEFRRIPFQKKIGAGLTLQEFEEKRKQGTLRHVGLTESISMIARSMGWKLSKTEDILTPVIAEKEIVTSAMTIKKGNSAGVQQIGKGYVDGVEKITLAFRASVGEPESYDLVEIDGNPKISSKIEGGVNGDVATCAITINAVKQILTAKPGLRTMSDISLVSFFQ